MEIEDNTFRILITTDTHLGYSEKKEGRRDDCYDVFEEILSHAESQNVDFIVHSGDFFHEKNPTKYCYTRTMKILRNALSGTPQESYTVDWVEAPLYPDNSYSSTHGIKYPMYVIHGNHDDPSGTNSYTGLDIVSTAGLVNYVNKAEELSEDGHIILNPVLFKKGETGIALYGMSYRKNEEMNRLWLEKKVQISIPDGRWFKILLMHQDRVKHDNLKVFPEALLKPYFDFVVFGHEHECIIEEGSPWAIQPGSSFPLSICEFEKAEKFCALLRVNKTIHQVNRLALRRVRQVFLEYNTLPANIDNSSATKVENYLERVAEAFYSNLPEAIVKDKAPMAKVIFEHSGLHCTPNLRALSSKFDGPLFNKGDCIKLLSRKKKVKIERVNAMEIVDDDSYNEEREGKRRAVMIESMMKSKFAEKSMKNIPNREIERIIENIDNPDSPFKLHVVIEHCLRKTINTAMATHRLNPDKTIEQVVQDITVTPETATTSLGELSDLEEKMDQEKLKAKATKPSKTTRAPTTRKTTKKATKKKTKKVATKIADEKKKDILRKLNLD
ncbi:Double-strand break repair protein [Entamoeba marina]